MAAYEVILHEQPWQALAKTQGPRRRQLIAVLDQVAADPSRVGDLQQSDSSGRRNEVILLGDWLVTYWPDHATREIRVVAVELAEE